MASITLLGVLCGGPAIGKALGRRDYVIGCGREAIGLRESDANCSRKSSRKGLLLILLLLIAAGLRMAQPATGCALGLSGIVLRTGRREVTRLLAVRADFIKRSLGVGKLRQLKSI